MDQPTSPRASRTQSDARGPLLRQNLPQASKTEREKIKNRDALAGIVRGCIVAESSSWTNYDARRADHSWGGGGWVCASPNQEAGHAQIFAKSAVVA